MAERERTSFSKLLWRAVATLIVAFVPAWWAGAFSPYFWGHPQVALWLENVQKGAPQPAEDRFRVVVCWLENDPDGDNMRSVRQAFRSVEEDVELVRSPYIVAAAFLTESDWRNDVQKHAALVLEKWDADLAVVGLVDESGKRLSLWFVRRYGEGPLNRAPYVVDKGVLEPQFREDFSAELITMALVAVAPLADTETRGRVLDRGLRNATRKLATLLDTSDSLWTDEWRARLQLSLGIALQTLGGDCPVRC